MDQTPDWIWRKPHDSGSANDGQRISFHRECVMEDVPRIAKFQLLADFCYLRVWINETQVVAVEPFGPRIDVDVTSHLQKGLNRIRIETSSIEGPCAFAAQLQVGVGNAPLHTKLVTDNAWTITDAMNRSDKYQLDLLGAVEPTMFGIASRSIEIDPTENYEQWRQATSGSKVENERFWVVPGFRVQHIKNATADEGSWVSMAFDPKGALTISKESKGLLRMTLNASGDAVSSTALINDELLECRGLAYAHQSLYANANNSKAMFRLRNLNENGVPDNFGFKEMTKLREFAGGVGHGRNDLAVGDDGWIYSIHGDSVEIPTSNIRSRMSPFWRHGQHGNAGNGHLLRTTANGDSWELLCAGLRNPYGIAQNEFGDWFTYDADAEFDMGTPWYRPTRVLQLVSGGDYGWRAVTGKWPPYFPDHADNAMPTMDIGKGSPTAVLFAYPASWPDAYRKSLLILDWTYGRVIAVHLHPRGAGYRASAETFLQGKPLNVTDLAFARDGTMYFVTGGRKTQSALYRVSFDGKPSQGIEASRHESDCRKHAIVMRRLRSQIEEAHVDASAFRSDLVWENLNAHDWQLRYAARIALEHQPIEAWSQKALAENRPRAQIEACMALIRSRDRSLTSQALQRLIALDSISIDLASQMALVRCYEWIDHETPELLITARQSVISSLKRILHSASQTDTRNRSGNSLSLQGDCIRLLVRLNEPTAVDLAIESLLSMPQQEWILYGLFAIRDAVDGWDLSKRREYFRSFERTANFVRGEGMEKFLKQIREDAVSALTGPSRDELSEVLASSLPSPDESAFVPARKPVRTWKLTDLEQAIARSTHTPSKERGKRIFAEAQCNRCHRFGKRGPAIGPDLTHVANRFSKNDLMASTVEPSRVIAENYRNAQVITKDGNTIVGRLLQEGDYRSEKISLATDPFQMSGNVEIAKSEIEHFRESELSPMPVGLLDGFSVEEIQDLLEYLADSMGSN